MSDDITAAFFEWIKRGSTGCLFALKFSNDPLSPGYWPSLLVPGQGDYDRIASVVQTFFSGTVGTAEAAQVILPGIVSGEHIIGLINALCATPNWFCATAERNERILIGLRWLLPDGRHVNWALGFANLESMPTTRRSPYTALIVRPGAPGRAPSVALKKPNEARERQLDRQRIPVHLADMETKMNDDLVQRTWRATQKKKAEKIENDQMGDAAKAKVTFALPLKLKGGLTCVPDVLTLK